MDIKTLNLEIKKKIQKKISCEEISIEDKTFLHVNHKSHNKNIKRKERNIDYNQAVFILATYSAFADFHFSV